ncbi:MAG: beta-N-acetylhexosaminidase [Clostridiales bacterium]|jgi:hypothetical protein|nr:beta-N-acetylhexosaminidase [Clostridiales bacterium]
MAFEKIALMLDCSRNAVPNVGTIKTLLDLMAKMGYNRLELYTEDTYEIKNRPYFGYLRGRYTGAEIKEIDAYAGAKGIELTPCIQVLAHLNQIFRWPAFDGVRDCDDILLVDEPETYALIEDMFRSVAQNFTSRNVNIGCDEAHRVGLGQYLVKHGFQDRFEIINRHVGKVLDIAKKYGFKCAMWSDMYFRLISGGEYYSTDKEIPQDILDRVPGDVSLIYWDYGYNPDVDSYRRMFAGHKRFGNDIEFAGGAWRWTGFAPDNAYSMKALEVQITAAKEFGVKSAMLTAWGDEGAEGSAFSFLPTLYYFARLCRGESTALADMEDGFKSITGVGFKDFLDIERINDYTASDGGTDVSLKPNADKFFLYNDFFLGIEDGNVTGKEPAHYRSVSGKLKAGSYGGFSAVFNALRALADVLELKAGIGARTRRLYRSGDKDGLKRLLDDYRLIEERIGVFHTLFREQWMGENKPFGFEVHDIRLGGLLQRAKTCAGRLADYCEGKIASIPELEEDILPYDSKMVYAHMKYPRLASPGRL